MESGLLISALAAIITTADCYCYSTTLYASTSSLSKSVSSSRYENCNIYIRPYSFYRSGYYLEISWSSSNFDIKGNMPSCNESYIEVFLTRNYKSIGKFCSNNAGSPFKMYSKDGYARVSYYKSGHSLSRGFTFNYLLKSRTSDFLGSTKNTHCADSVKYGNSGVMYSNGWPSGYLQSWLTCEYKIRRSNNHQGVYVVFMDINLHPSRHNSDCVQLFGSNISFYYRAISSQFCGSEEIKKYTTYNKYLRIDFSRWIGGGSSYSGFVAGYIMFGPQVTIAATPTTSGKKPFGDIASSNALGITLSVTLPLIFIIIAVTVCSVAICIKRRRRQNTTRERVYHNLTCPSASTSQNATSQSFPAVQGMTNITFLQAQPKRTSHSTSEHDRPGNPPPQYSCVVTPTVSSVPTGALQGIQGQQLATIPSEDAPPNYPPPSYSTVFNS